MAENIVEEGRSLHERQLINYEICFNTWVNIKIELDKTILGLSVAGLGFVLSILVSEKSPPCVAATLIAISGVAFLICIGVVIFALKKSADYVAENVQSIREYLDGTKVVENNGSNLDSEIRALHIILNCVFLVAVVLAALGCMAIYVSKYFNV
ncbi:hypothetical protein ACUHMQ_18995 [Chitinimonas sp. PSY-7]|uniref:hypothetical protein n=1 Tax=Chitinimonas sp. PSY-7 TaxID=3459088 RepID=UPI00403FD2A7